ncbi:CsgG/HfaB family protein [Myxacorys almedinensis]|uniref:Penicillin-binding protein activator LpoB n=1 Tax=Myxacorys almedinensis A TaxID=2690445 RepID=A0A8J7YZI7_9CYAN|nr:CsgG/HfaB family protein [Myxacorys almedinensis]NDJ17472.1 penicillin-binding protein activator LpoB [Myxacorys almedinensis A]
MKISSNFRALSLNAAAIVMALGLSLSAGVAAFAQSKPTISIPEFKNQTSWWWWGNGTARELADALSNELTATGKFSVVERQKLGAVLSEQELAQLGLVRPGTEAKKGQITGSQYIVLGQVTSYEEGVSDESTGGRVGGINLGGIRIGGGARQAKQQAYIAVDLRVVNSTTGEVVHARTIEGRATSESKGADAGISIRGVSLGGDRNETKRAPVGKALRAALVEATDYLGCVMVEKGACIAKFDAKDQKRREGTRGVLELD